MKAIMQLSLEGKKRRNSRQTKHIYRNSPYIKENSLQETQREFERLLLLPLVLYIKDINLFFSKKSFYYSPKFQTDLFYYKRDKKQVKI